MGVRGPRYKAHGSPLRDIDTHTLTSAAAAQSLDEWTYRVSSQERVLADVSFGLGQRTV